MSFFEYIDNGKGPTKLFLGGVHGNEGKTSIKFIKLIKQEDLSCGQFYHIFARTPRLLRSGMNCTVREGYTIL